MEDRFFEQFGMSRVQGPKSMLPTSAWSLDNSREIRPSEMRIAVRKIHMEATNFRQLQLESGDDIEKIKEKVTDIVKRRGKLHNPTTDTAGIAYGIVEEIGSAYENPKGLKPGDAVICNVSLASLPLFISKINKIDLAYSQLDVEGYAILFNRVPTLRVPAGVPINLLLLIMDESGTLLTVSEKAAGKKRVLVVGNNIMINMIYGWAAKKKAGKDAKIICLLDERLMVHGENPEASSALDAVFDEVRYVDILRPIECMRSMEDEPPFDLSINCADIPGAETVNILATREGGTVIFANLINNFNISLYITEAGAKQLEILSAVGYIKGYEDFDIELARDLAPLFEKAKFARLKGLRRIQNYAMAKEARLLDSMANITTLADDFICESRAMREVLEKVTAVSKYDCTVFITGETGVGKEKVANIIQKNSARKMQEFVKVNCAAISPTLIESELFGYEKGAFTGASSSGKKGYFEQADNGTIFLDEIGELPLEIQVKLLRVIQEGVFYKVGSSKPNRVNVRVICATNRDIESMVEEGTFREDLYYRLCVFPIRIPNLAERPEDIPALVLHFIDKYGQKFGITREISYDAMEYLLLHDWPGNIREIENVVQRLLINAKAGTILPYDVTKELNQDLFSGMNTQSAAAEPVQSGQHLGDVVNEFEKQMITEALEKYGSTRKAANAIGISQSQLIRKKKKYGIE